MIQRSYFKQYDFRLPLAIVLTVLLAVMFWSGSRYPALNEKAAMGGDTPLSGLSFDIVLELFPDSSLWWALIANTVNWIATNLNGMTFGVLFGSMALTLLSLLQKRSFKSGFANSALGAVIGAPLGVCVNCAAPIALGLHAGRMRLETTLSALLASPTLNVIVVSMSFALLPPHMAALKLILSLILVLLVVPLLCRFILTAETIKSGQEPAATGRVSTQRGFTAWIAKVLMPVDADSRPHNLIEAIVWFAKNYFRNFFFVFLVTVPLMLLAALLGATVATFVAPNELASLLPARSIISIGVVIILIAMIASFVPAPIALDVILTVILLGVGMSEHYAMALMIGLGSFSVYAFAILWKAISLRTGLAVWATVIGMSVAAGFITYWGQPIAQRYYFEQQVETIQAVDGIDFPRPEDLPTGKSLSELQPILDSQRLTLSPVSARLETTGSGDISVSRLDSAKQSNAPGTSGASETQSNFSRIVGPDVGLIEKGVISPFREFGYHVKGGGIAAGDVHGDGWTDIVTRRSTFANGLSLYANVGGRFERQELDLGPVDETEVFHVTLADLDGDKQLDLVVSTLRNGEYLFFNQGGDFSKDNMVQLYEPELAVLASIAFADLDEDGDLDIVAGKWAPRGASIGWGITPLHNRNQIYWNLGNRKFVPEIIPYSNGQTLTLLISDFDNDGRLDILDGDDAAGTDAVTYFNENGQIAKHDVNRHPFPFVLNSTMSYAEGDWNNDLRADYYGAQIAQTRQGANRQTSNRTLFELCEQFASDLKWSREQQRACAQQLLEINMIKSNQANAADCSRLSDPEYRALCASAELIRGYANRFRTMEPDTERHAQCTSYLTHIPEMKLYCASLTQKVEPRWTSAERKGLFRGALNRGNILLTGQSEGGYADQAEAVGVRWPGWSWNSKFTDLDQDGKQDILVMTGIWQRSASTTTNMLLHNKGDRFADATETFGFFDLTPSYGYVQLDYDHDGDVDIIRDNMSLRMIVHRNERPAGEALWVHLRDAMGNSMGVGARVTICVDKETIIRPGKCQMRTIRASGGYMSGDPIAAHFGLGDAEEISVIEVRWPDGEVSRIMPDNLQSGSVWITRER